MTCLFERTQVVVGLPYSGAQQRPATVSGTIHLPGYSADNGTRHFNKCVSLNEFFVSCTSQRLRGPVVYTERVTLENVWPPSSGTGTHQRNSMCIKMSHHFVYSMTDSSFHGFSSSLHRKLWFVLALSSGNRLARSCTALARQSKRKNETSPETSFAAKSRVHRQT